MKAWMRVSATGSEREGRSLEMFLRWYKADLVIDFMCDWKDSIESRMIPRLWTSVDGETVQPSTSRRGSPSFWSSALEATTVSSVLLVFSLSRFYVIQSFISCRQLMSDCGGSWVDGLVQRYIRVSST